MSLAFLSARSTCGKVISRSNFSFSPGATLCSVVCVATLFPPSTRDQAKESGSAKRVLLKMPKVRVAFWPEPNVQSHWRTSTARGAQPLYWLPSASLGDWQKSHPVMPNQR